MVFVAFKTGGKSIPPLEPDRRFPVPKGLLGRIAENPPGKHGLFQFGNAPRNTAFCGVMNMVSGAFALRPLVPRHDYENYPPPPPFIKESATYVGYLANADPGAGGPLDHPAKGGPYQGQTSHNQLRAYAIATGGKFAEGTEDDFLGFSVRKHLGNTMRPHLLTMISGTLNRKFSTEAKGCTMPADWAFLVQESLRFWLPLA